MHVSIGAAGRRLPARLLGSGVGLLSAWMPRVTPGETLPTTVPTVPTVLTMVPTTAPATLPTMTAATAPATAPAMAPTMAPTTVPTTADPLSLSSTPGSTCNMCPEKWVNFQHKCYYFGEGAKRWIQAREACSKLQGRLVSIHSQEEQVGLGSAEDVASIVVRGAVEPHPNLLNGKRAQEPLQAHPPCPAPQDFLAKYINRKGSWIGLRDLDIEGQFVWMDQKPLTYR